MSQEAFGDLKNPKTFFSKTRSSTLSRINMLEENQDLSLFNSPKVRISEELELCEMHFVIHSSILSIPS